MFSCKSKMHQGSTWVCSLIFYFYLTRGRHLTQAESVVVPAYKLKVHNPKLVQSESFSRIFELGTRENKISFSFLMEEDKV